ncbi:MAG: NADH-quinone oxidoreductase subunit M [Dactylosporangium sp.]|nr:NADH-quinone oxidoreductase subunit M [Dactylosporangium sp.]NNJ61454.1 NADH-quinone oxidoreductase subunit M [Dactylosporangium sp.]
MNEAMLVATLAVPAAGAVCAAVLPERAGRLAGAFAALVALGFAIGLYGRPPALPAGAAEPPIRPWHEVDVAWVPAFDLRFHLGVDGVSYPLVVLTALLTALCAIYTIWRAGATSGRDAGPVGGGRLMIALLLAVEVGINGVFLSLDLVLFFVFFEIVLLPMYAIIAAWGGPDRRRAAHKFVLYTLFGSVLLLVGVILVVVNAGTADLVALTEHPGLTRNMQLAAFVFLALGLAVKSPLWPLHTWLPDAHTEAPTVGSVILAGVLLKMGTYGLLRIAVGVAPEAARTFAPALGILAATAIIVGGLACLAQTELKRLIAYSSVGHMGFVVLGIATLTATGFQAAVIGNVAHGLITGLLFFLAGAIKDRAHTGQLADLGGLRETAPGLSGVLGFAAIASLGLPGLAGFWGEAFAVFAAIDKGGALWITLGAVAAVGAALAAAYFLRLLRRVTHGAATPAVAALAGTADARIARVELVAWGPLMVLTLLVGLLPALIIGIAADPISALAQVVAP